MAGATFAQGRLEQDLMDIQKQAIEVHLVNDNVFHWEVVIEGPSETMYFGYTYTIHLNFPDNYPFKPPKVKFIPCIVHPNVSNTGELLISSFLPSEGDYHSNACPTSQKWSPAWTAEEIIKQIITVLEDPDPYMIVNKDAAVVTQKGVTNSKLKDEGSQEEATVEAMNSKLNDEESDILQDFCTVSRPSKMLIKVKTLNGKEIELDIEPNDKVKRIKECVEEREGIPLPQQRLIFGGKQMNDEQTAQDYKVTEGSVLHLVLALRGGHML